MRWAWLGVTLVLLVLHEDGASGQVFSEPITDAATSGPSGPVGPSDVAFAEAGAATTMGTMAGEEDDEEGGEPGPDGVVLGGNMKQAYNLFEHRVPVVPTPLSPSPFVEHPVPSDGQNLYPTSHTYSQLTLTPDNGEVKPNAGDGVAATTMPWQYRPYIKQEKLNRYVEPLVYKSMYSWTPSAPGKGDVSVQDAIPTARDMFKPKDWKVRIEQKGANVEITRRGPDWYLGGGGNNGAQIARPTMPPEFYQFSAPTPPLFHSPVPPAPRKGHSNPALKGPSIYPTSAMAFLEETVDVTPAVPAATTSAAPVPAATPMMPPQSLKPTAPTPTTAAPAAKPAANPAELSAPASELDAMTARLAQRIRVYQSQLRAARDAADLAVHNAYSAALKDHSAVVAAHRNVAAARAVSAHQKWAKVNAELDALPHARYDALKQEYRGLQGRPYDSYKRLRAALQRHRDNLSNPAPYDPYDRYADLHTALYGSAPPRFAQQRATRSATEAEAESAAMVMAAEAEVAAAETDAEWNNAGAETELGFSTGAPPAEFMAAEEDAAITAAFAADAIDADAAIDAPLSAAVPAHGVNSAVAAIADAATEEETAEEVATAVAAAAVADAELTALSKDVTPRSHIPLFYPSVRAAMRRAAATRAL